MFPSYHPDRCVESEALHPNLKPYPNASPSPHPNAGPNPNANPNPKPSANAYPNPNADPNSKRDQAEEPYTVRESLRNLKCNINDKTAHLYR